MTPLEGLSHGRKGLQDVRRLRAVERREPEPKVWPRVIEAWEATPPTLDENVEDNQTNAPVVEVAGYRRPME